VTIFNQFVEDIGEEVHNLESDTIKLGIITDVITPNATDATPAWSTASGVDYDGNEVGTGGGYTANGETVGSVGWDISGATATLSGADVSLAQDASGFTNGAWGILYNSSAAASQAIAFVELDSSGGLDETAGDININWNSDGILTVAVT
jgi:hypothetical protein